MITLAVPDRIKASGRHWYKPPVFIQHSQVMKIMLQNTGRMEPL